MKCAAVWLLLILRPRRNIFITSLIKNKYFHYNKRGKNIILFLSHSMPMYKLNQCTKAQSTNFGLPTSTHSKTRPLFRSPTSGDYDYYSISMFCIIAGSAQLLYIC